MVHALFNLATRRRLLWRRRLQRDRHVRKAKRFRSVGLPALVEYFYWRTGDNERRSDCAPCQSHCWPNAWGGNHCGCGFDRSTPPRFFAPCATWCLCRLDCYCRDLVLRADIANQTLFISGYANAFEESLPANTQFVFLPKPFTLVIAAARDRASEEGGSVQAEHAVDGAQLSRLDQPRVCHRHPEQGAFELLLPKGEKIQQRRKFRKQIVILPDVCLQQRGMIRHPIKNLGRRKSVAQHLFPEVVGNNPNPRNHAHLHLRSACQGMAQRPQSHPVEMRSHERNVTH